MNYLNKYLPFTMAVLFLSQIYGQKAEGTYYLSISHEVADYQTWKSGYDKHLAARQAAGLEEIFVKKDVNNVRSVTTLFEVKDLMKAKAFLSDPGLKEAMTKAGVVTAPQIEFYKSSSAAAELNTETLLSIITSRVEDFSSWKAKHQITDDIKQKCGISDQFILQSLSDEHQVLVINCLTSLSGFDTFIYTEASYWNADQPQSGSASGQVVAKPNIRILF